jgi:hypothetical protein
MRTTFDLPDPLFREVKIRAVQQGVKLKHLVAHYLETGLRSQSTPLNAAHGRPRSALPVFRVPNGKTIPALTNAQLHALLDEEDLAQSRQRRHR